MTYRTCQRGGTCHKANVEYDGTSATRVLGDTPEERAKVPEELSEAILDAVEEANRNPPPEQTKLVTDGGRDEPPSAGTDRETFWLVYLYQYEPEEPGGYLWTPVGLVEDRQVWQDWWEQVVTGEIELPHPYNTSGWWCSDKPVQIGLWDGGRDD